MAVLTDLPTELLDTIFHMLESIDDVHGLGRACRATNKSILQPNAYTEIMRSVIARSRAHRFDFQLCRILDLHNHIVCHYAAGGPSIQPSTIDSRELTVASLNMTEFGLWMAVTDNRDLVDYQARRTALTPHRVHDILARWQGLRTLQHLWLCRQLEEADYLPLNYSSDAGTFVDAYITLLERSYRCNTRKHEHYTSFNSDQRDRFHAAVTGLWLKNEIRWVLAQFTYPSNTFRAPLRILELCKDRIGNQINTPLLDQFDEYSIYTFLYHHLLPLHSLPLANQCRSRIPLTFPSDLDKGDTTYKAKILQSCLMAGQAYLQPPDLIDLLVRNQLMRRPPWPRVSLPASTMTYIRPYSAIPFPPNHSLSRNGALGLIHPHIGYSCLMHLRHIQRATFCQSLSYRAADGLPMPMTGLYQLKDQYESYFKGRIETEFELYARRDRRDLKEVFEDNWIRYVRWGVWWWANSEEKARMKMERWRLV